MPKDTSSHSGGDQATPATAYRTGGGGATGGGQRENRSRRHSSKVIPLSGSSHVSFTTNPQPR